MSATEAVRQSFDRMADDYAATMEHELQLFLGCSYAAFIDRILARLAPQSGECFLDIATGTAQIPLALTATLNGDCQIVGLDITPAMLVQAQTARGDRSVPIHLTCGSGTALPLASRSFDGVICGMGMHHMNPDAMVREMHRVLSPGGRLIMIDAGASPFWCSGAGRGLLRALLWIHGLGLSGARAAAELEALDNLLPAAGWRDLLERCGFYHIDIQESRARRPWYPNVLEISALAR